MIISIRIIGEILFPLIVATIDKKKNFIILLDRRLADEK
jgi:hypothetical protein